ncbi:MAG: NAD(P)-dependent oxidoreductase [SAR202 cluster bacterium]|nr:NAD(P)-dependent oxidoreductase [SAR202 cluster bacterium]
MKKVLITGMSGLIGGILRRHLEELGGYELSALNRRPVDGVECFQADIADFEAIKPAFVGKDVVVHLSAYVDEVDDWNGNLSGNIIGVHNVYEAARLAGVKRVVFASSGNAISGIQRFPPYDAIAEGRYGDVPEGFPKVTHEMVHPKSVYGAAKAWGEALGRHFADQYGLSVLCVRIGAVRKEDRPRLVPWENSVYLSHRDIAQMLERCINAPDDLLYDIFFALSDNKWAYRDLEHPREVLGYVPQDSADVFE